jgi:hypothetical protein
MSRVLFPALPDFSGAVDLERGPLIFVRTTVELLGRIRSGSGLETRK